MNDENKLREFSELIENLILISVKVLESSGQKCLSISFKWKEEPISIEIKTE